MKNIAMVVNSRSWSKPHTQALMDAEQVARRTDPIDANARAEDYVRSSLDHGEQCKNQLRTALLAVAADMAYFAYTPAMDLDSLSITALASATYVAVRKLAEPYGQSLLASDLAMLWSRTDNAQLTSHDVSIGA